MITMIRKAMLRRRIQYAMWDAEYWASGVRVAQQNEIVSRVNLEKAQRRERILRDALINADYPLPRVLRSRGLT